jgi:hypothetical protein
MDAPALSPSVEWRAPQAMSINEQLVKGRNVTLVKDVSETDSSGYYLRYVMADSTFVNYELVRQGLGKVVITPPDVACQNSLLAAQTEAQAIVAGLWEPTPLPTYTITPTPTITLTPTETKEVPAVCDCDGPILTCNNFRNWNQAQACFDYCVDQGYGDIFNLDKNGNGVACDGLRP